MVRMRYWLSTNILIIALLRCTMASAKELPELTMNAWQNIWDRWLSKDRRHRMAQHEFSKSADGSRWGVGSWRCTGADITDISSA